VVQVEQEESHSKLPGGVPRWNPKAIKGMIGVSGVYNCFGLADHLHKRGLYRSLFDRIMSINGVPQLKLLSPIYCIKVTAFEFSATAMRGAFVLSRIVRSLYPGRCKGRDGEI
jgi:hypothetical protein